MAWRWLGADGRIEIVVEPDFRGDLLALASARPIWIVDTRLNGPRIDLSWQAGKDADIFYINKFTAKNPSDREESLVGALACLDDHYGEYSGLIIHGAAPSAALTRRLMEEGFEIIAPTPDGFEANRLPDVRDRLIGR